MAKEVGSVEAVPAGNVVAFQVEGQAIAVANVDGTFYAFDDICSHRGCSLAEGMLEGALITCPCHFSVFQVTDGAVVQGPAKTGQTTYAVEVRDGKIVVEEGAAEVTGSPAPAALVASASPPASAGASSGAAGTEEHDERVHAALSSVPLFADLDQDAIERLEAFTFTKDFAAGEIIVEEGHTGNGLYVVVSGSVEVIKGISGPNPRRVTVLRAGEPFGEMALLGDWKRSASVRALEDVQCVGMDRWAFLSHLKREPNLAIRMLQMLANRLMETNNRLAE